MVDERSGIGSEYSKTKFSAQRRLIFPERQRAGNKRQRQVIGDEGEGEGKKEEGRRVFVLEGDKGLSLDRGETDVAHRKMAVYKGTRGNPLG